MFTWDGWEDGANLGDLKGLRTVLSSLLGEEPMCMLEEEHGIKPVVAIRNMRGMDEGCDGARYLRSGPGNLSYDYCGCGLLP